MVVLTTVDMSDPGIVTTPDPATFISFTVAEELVALRNVWFAAPGTVYRKVLLLIPNP